MRTTIPAVPVGQTASCGRRDMARGIFEGATDHPVDVSRTRLTDDEPSDRVDDGGPEKAPRHLRLRRRRRLESRNAELADHLDPDGAVGANLPTGGLAMAEVRIDDVHRRGTAPVRVAQSTRLRRRLNRWFGSATPA